MAVTQISACDEFIEFITSSPTLEQNTNFTISETIRELRDANHTRRLTDAEDAELDEYIRLDHIVRKAKIRAYQKLDQQSAK